MTERGYQLLQDTVERLLRRNATVHLRNILKKTHPADIAYLFKLLNERSAQIVFELLPDTETAAEVLSEMQPALRVEFLQHVATDRLAEILSAMADDDTADLLADLPDEFREQILELMSQEDTEEVAERLSYPEDSAGRIMTTDFLALPETMSAQEAVQEVRKASETEMVFYLYVTDGENRLAGVLSLRQLVTAADETKLSSMMTSETVKVRVTTDQEEAARLVSRYNLLAIPVVDHNEVLVGIITVDDVIDVLREEATEDILKMAGTSEEEISSFSVWRSVRVRLPWLFAAWIGGVAAIKIIGGFEDHFGEQIALFASLAAFIPVIMGMGGNIGTQSLSITVRGLATGRIDPKLLWRVVFKEIRVGLLLGIAYGLLLALVGWVLNKNFTLGMVVGIAMCGNMTLAAVVGTFLPLIAVKLRIDPAVASGPFVTTSIDVLGVTLYFLTALLIIVR
jgi:magnesium transporter